MSNVEQPPAQAADFSGHVGRSEETSGTIAAGPMELMAALLNRPLEEIAPQGLLPPLWHWLVLQRFVPQSGIGADGHPKRGGLIPPITLPRRMFAGSRTSFQAPLAVGDQVRRVSTIKAIQSKSGRSGELVFVTLNHEIHGPRGLAVSEDQDLVYRGATSGAAATTEQRAPSDGQPDGFETVETHVPDPVLLFRFSAATANSHRIHYDADYTRDVEGYPGLVVHGPLQAILLADLAVRYLRRPLSEFAFRAVKPTFVDRPLHCAARRNGMGAALETLDEGHATCMSATAK